MPQERRRRRKDRRSPDQPQVYPEPRSGIERRKNPPPYPVSPRYGWVDQVFFRALGLAMIWHEPIVGSFNWEMLAGGFWAFFMPDALRGRSSPIVKLLLAMIARRSGRG